MLDLNRTIVSPQLTVIEPKKFRKAKRTQKAKVVRLSTVGYQRTVFVSHSKFTIVAYFFI